VATLLLVALAAGGWFAVKNRLTPGSVATLNRSRALKIVEHEATRLVFLRRLERRAPPPFDTARAVRPFAGLSAGDGFTVRLVHSGGLARPIRYIEVRHDGIVTREDARLARQAPRRAMAAVQQIEELRALVAALITMPRLGPRPETAVYDLPGVDLWVRWRGRSVSIDGSDWTPSAAAVAAFVEKLSAAVFPAPPCACAPGDPLCSCLD
jgi:hypothetical protein